MNVCTPDEQDEAPWPATYIRLCKLPKYWICAFLKNKSSHIAPAQADQLFDGHGNLMMEVFCFVTGTGVELQFPKGSHDKRVCTQVFSTRLSETGGRLAAIERPLLELLTGKAKFDWQSLGIYRFEPPADEESRVTHILHISGVKAFRWGSQSRFFQKPAWGQYETPPSGTTGPVVYPFAIRSSLQRYLDDMGGGPCETSLSGV